MLNYTGKLHEFVFKGIRIFPLPEMNAFKSTAFMSRPIEKLSRKGESLHNQLAKYRVYTANYVSIFLLEIS